MTRSKKSAAGRTYNLSRERERDAERSIAGGHWREAQFFRPHHPRAELKKLSAAPPAPHRKNSPPTPHVLSHRRSRSAYDRNRGHRDWRESDRAPIAPPRRARPAPS